MAVPTDLETRVGKIMPKSYLPGFIILSCLFSYIGTWTTLELLHRRTSLKGIYNWIQIVCASITIGGIAVWGMWFLGNRAIKLGDGSIGLQIAYSPGFTALSFFFPVVIFALSFCIDGVGDNVNIFTTEIGAIVASVGVISMHYIGQAGISNYSCLYNAKYATGAAIIVTASFSLGLLMFSIYRASWHSTWWKRGLCASLIATAVCSSNWLASAGTQYRFIKANSVRAVDYKSATVITIVLVFVFACVALIGLTTLAHRRLRYAMQECQQVALAVAIFDIDGKIMVSPEGFLPTRRVADEYYERNLYDAFTNRHPLFLWMFRASHYWPSVTNLLPAMRRHLHQHGLAVHRISSKISTRSRSHIGFKLTTDAGEPMEAYSILFRELFCIAAAELAEDLRVDFEDLGILFNDVIPTGSFSHDYPKISWLRDPPKIPSQEEDVENPSTALIGKGQLLFLVKRVDARGCAALEASGHRFAPLPNVLAILSRTMQIPSGPLEAYIDKMRHYVGEAETRESGVHLTCFAIRPSIKTGFDILVQKNAVNLTPSVQFPFSCLEQWQSEYLKQFDQLTLLRLCNYLTRISASVDASPKERKFNIQLLEVIESLKHQFFDNMIRDAVFIARTFQAPCRGSAQGLSDATLIAFRLIIPIHTRQAPGIDLAFWPLNLFKVQQRVYLNSSDPRTFARRVLREFVPIITSKSNSLQPDDTSPHHRLNPVRLFADRPQSLHMEIELGYELDAEGDIVRQKLHRIHVPYSWWTFRRDKMDHLIQLDTPPRHSRAVTQDEFTQGSNVPASKSGKENQEEESVQSPTDDVQMLHGKTKTGQVSLVAKEDMEPTTFVDQIFAKCIESKIQSSHSLGIQYAIPEV